MLFTSKAIANITKISQCTIQKKLYGIKPQKIGFKGTKLYEFDMLPGSLCELIVAAQNSGTDINEQAASDFAPPTPAPELDEIEASPETIEDVEIPEETPEYIEPDLEKLHLVTPELIAALLNVFGREEVRNVLIYNYGLITEV